MRTSRIKNLWVTMNFVDMVLSEGPSVMVLASFSPKRISNMVVAKSKGEGLEPNKPNLHNSYKPSFFR